jgi:hypothetical protein
MRGFVKVLGACSIAVLASSAVTSAAQASELVLKSAGHVVAPGSAAGGRLRFGPCGTFTSTGTLASNEARVDRATFTVFEETIGGCGEGGPTISGLLESMQVTANGALSVKGMLRYKTSLPKTCEYVVTRLTGRISVPGMTMAALSGQGRRVRMGGGRGCRPLKVSGAEATLFDLETGEPFEAEIGVG